MNTKWTRRGPWLGRWGSALVFKKVDFPHGEDDLALAEQWLPRQHPEYLREDPFYKPYQEDGNVCWRLWRSAVINWDGGFAPCCYLTDKTQDFGDLNESSVKEVWNNEKYTTARGLFNKDFVPGEWVGCLDCSVYLGSSAARRRGPVDLYLEPVALQINGPKSGSKEGSKDESPVSGSEGGYVSKNGHACDAAGAKTEEPAGNPRF